MAATVELKIYTGASAATESPAGDATNWNLMSTDAYDSTGTSYQTNRITVVSGSTVYSYERWMRLKFSGTFNLIENIKFYHSSGSLSDANLDLLAGTSATGVTPVTTVSSIATTTLTSWDAVGEAIDCTPASPINSSPGYTKYCVVQLKAPDTVTTPGDIGSQQITWTYEES